ncbi:hypothetical protein EVAR_30410_1 [Eumeta japonica]|uniref:Uncharacterized protein n=1 Tax=Eumeta variegata TaxID=151549 RepID=A0A4C1W6W5_EUMVA|nr:hypothetical protein EVAR_30410_1 [Eumeta japonica]
MIYNNRSYCHEGVMVFTCGPTSVIWRLYPSTSLNRSSLVTMRLAAVSTAGPRRHSSTREPADDGDATVTALNALATTAVNAVSRGRRIIDSAQEHR